MIHAQGSGGAPPAYADYDPEDEAYPSTRYPSGSRLPAWPPSASVREEASETTPSSNAQIPPTTPPNPIPATAAAPENAHDGEHGYHSAEVLLLQWEEDDLLVDQEVAALQGVFKVGLNFTTHRWKIPSIDSEEKIYIEYSTSAEGRPPTICWFSITEVMQTGTRRSASRRQISSLSAQP